MGVTCSDQAPGTGWAGAWGDTDGYFSVGDTDFSGAEQNITQSFSVPGGFDSLWVETAMGVTRISDGWAHDPGPFSRAIRVFQDVPAPGFLLDGITPAYLTVIGTIDVFSGSGIKYVSVDLVAINQATTTTNVVRLAMVFDLALAGDTWSSVKLGTAVYSTAHKFGVVAGNPNTTSPDVTIVPGLAALDRHGVFAQLVPIATDYRPDGEFALVAMPDAAVDPFAAYDDMVEGAAVSPDSALVAVWGPRTVPSAGPDAAIQGEVLFTKPVVDVTFPVNTGKTVGDVRRG